MQVYEFEVTKFQVMVVSSMNILIYFRSSLVLILVIGLIASSNLIAGELKAANKNECKFSDHCIRESIFEARLLKMRKRGKHVTIAMKLSNLSSKKIETCFFRKYVIVVSDKGEEAFLSTNRFCYNIPPAGEKSLGFKLEFKKKAPGDVFDVTLEIERPFTSFSFIDVSTASN